MIDLFKQPFYYCKYKALSDMAADCDIVAQCSSSEIDVVRGNKGEARLRKMGLCERFINWLFSTNEKWRLARMQAYVRLIYQTPLALSIEKQKQFYSKLRTWAKIDVNLGHLSEDILKELSPYLVPVRKAHQEMMGQRSLTPKQLQETDLLAFQARCEETRLAAELGIGSIPASSGVNGAKFGLGLDGRRLTVVKENEKDARSFNEGTFGLRTQPEVCQHDPRIAGAVAFMASEYFGFDLVPPTYTDENGYSIQLFVEDLEPAHKAKIGGSKLRAKPADQFEDDEIELLQTKAILNYFLGELDGTDDKLLLKLDKSGHILALVEIDNDNTFPANVLEKRKDAWTLWGKTHAWKNHKWAKKELKPRRGSKLDTLLRKLFDKDEMGAFLEKVHSEYPRFLSGERLCLLQERLAVLKMSFACALPLSDLGEMYSLECIANQEYSELLQKYYSFNVNPFNDVVFSPAGPPLEEAIEPIAEILEVQEDDGTGLGPLPPKSQEPSRAQYALASNDCD